MFGSGKQWAREWRAFLARASAILDRKLRAHFIRIAMNAAQDHDQAAYRRADVAVRTIIAHQVKVKNEVSNMALQAAGQYAGAPILRNPDGTPKEWKPPSKRQYAAEVNDAHRRWRATRAGLIVNAVSGLMRRAKTIVAQESLTGGDVAEIRVRIETRVARVARASAEAAAMSETHAASTAAQEAAVDALGLPIESKRWIATGDDRTRPTHSAASGQERKKSEPFTVGGYSLMMPGDSSLGAPPGETINCRCGVTYTVGSE